VEARDGDYVAAFDVVRARTSGLTKDASRDLRVVLVRATWRAVRERAREGRGRMDTDGWRPPTQNYGEHGRELVPVDAGLVLLEALADGEDAVVALARGVGKDGEARLRETLRRTTFVVVPVENERGRMLVEGGDACERKNGRGVDPNRNWDIDWGVKAPDYDPKEEFPGEKAFSEPESRMLRDLVASFKPHAMVNWHSGMSAIFTPYDYVAREPTGAGAEAMMRMARVIDAEHCENKCTLGSGGKGVGYLAHGTATDYIYEKMKVPVVYTWEIFGDLNAPYEDCYRAFNPTTNEAYDAVVNAWAGAPITLVSMLETHPDIVIERESTLDFGSTSSSIASRLPTLLSLAVICFVSSTVLRRRRAKRATSASRIAQIAV